MKRQEEEVLSLADIMKLIESFFGKNRYILPNAKVPKELFRIQNSLKSFFEGNEVLGIEKLQWYCGGNIPDELIFSRRNFILLNNISFTEAINLAHASVKKSSHLAKSGKKKNPHIKICVRTIHRCEKLVIPLDHIGGLILLYCELCESVKLL